MKMLQWQEEVLWMEMKRVESEAIGGTHWLRKLAEATNLLEREAYSKGDHPCLLHKGIR